MQHLILIIEDSQNTQRLIEKAVHSITQIDARILKANCGTKAIEIAEKYPIDIFIIDIKLPDNNGIEVASILRKNYPYAPIIFETKIMDKNIELYAHRQTICTSFLIKPFSIEQVRDAINKALEFCYFFKPQDKILKIKKSNSKICFNLKHILYIEATSGDILICYFDEIEKKLKEQRIKNYSLKKIESALEDSKCLVQCHRSYLINPKHIIEIDYSEKTVELDYIQNGIPIGDKFKKNLY